MWMTRTEKVVPLFITINYTIIIWMHCQNGKVKPAQWNNITKSFSRCVFCSLFDQRLFHQRKKMKLVHTQLRHNKTKQFPVNQTWCMSNCYICLYHITIQHATVELLKITWHFPLAFIYRRIFLHGKVKVRK